MRNKLDVGILDALSEIGARVTTKQAEAADAPTDHPVGSAPDGDQAATEGSFATENEQYSKENAGPQGVDAAPEEAVNPEKKQDNLPSQEELNPGTADDPPPAEIKPKKVVTSGDDDDKGELGGPNEGSGEGEGNVGGVGGPKFDGKSASAIKACDEFLKEASAIVPQVEEGEASEESDENLIPETEAKKLASQEKVAAESIARTLEAAGVPADATLEEKRAALVRAVTAQGEKAANGFLLSLDEETLKQVLNGTTKSAQDDPSDAMPPAIPSGDPVAAAGGMPPEAAAGAAPPAAAGGDPTGGLSPEEMIAQVIEAVQAQEITPEEAIQLLQQLGVPEEVIQQIAAQFGGGAPPAAPEQDPAMAAAAPPPEAGGAEASAEDVVAV